MFELERSDNFWLSTSSQNNAHWRRSPGEGQGLGRCHKDRPCNGLWICLQEERRVSCVNFTAFYEALLNAKGIDLGGGSAGVGKGGRKLSYTAKVQGNGNLLMGKAYTAMLDLQAGDEFEIRLGKKAIRLIPVGGEEEGEE